MPLTTASQVILEGNLPSDLDEEKISPHIDAAETWLREYISDEVYEEYEADDDEDPQSDRGLLAKAEALLAIETLLPVLNIRANPTSGGIVASVGFAESKNQLISQDELDRLTQRFHDRAMAIVARFVEIELDDAGDVEDVEFGDGIGFIAI